MNKKDLIDVIVISIFIIALATWNGVLNAKNDLKQNTINELQNKVEKQIELIDALQQ